MAKALWPKVLAALRRPGVDATREVDSLMSAARGARSVEEFEKLGDQLAAGRRGG